MTNRTHAGPRSWRASLERAWTVSPIRNPVSAQPAGSYPHGMAESIAAESNGEPGVIRSEPLPIDWEHPVYKQGRKLADKRRSFTLFSESARADDVSTLRQIRDLHAALLGETYGVVFNCAEIGMDMRAFLGWSAGNRAGELAVGFADDVEAWNFTSATPLIRLQLDNFLRLDLVGRAGPDSTIVNDLLSGEPLNAVEDPTAEPSAKGRRPKLTDRQLMKGASTTNPWVQKIYEESSRWIHLSNRHHVASYSFEGDEFQGRVPPAPGSYPEDFIEDVLWAMTTTTLGVLSYLNYMRLGYESAASEAKRVHP